MDKFIIEGSHKLKGTVYISGSKNAALPILASALLNEKPLVIKNVPKLKDVFTTIKLLQEMGCKCDFADSLKIDCSTIKSTKAPYELVKTMRASILVLGPLLARFKHACVSMPGGCAIGVRPVNLHIEALKNMGAQITIEDGYIKAQADELKGADIYLDLPTVTGTENIMMAATLAKGYTTIKNAAKEPEIVNLAEALNKMGAHIAGAGESIIKIEGVDHLHESSDLSIMSDRIEAGTFMCMALATGSSIDIKHAPTCAMDAIRDKFLEANGIIKKVDDETIKVWGENIKPINIKTMAYPGFPTDMQAQFVSMLTRASGVSIVEETIFENRFQHVAELKRMGADITLSGNKAIIKGVDELTGAPVMATDLRASASLVIAALSARGITDISRIYHLDRGYEQLDVKLSNLGAKIRRVKE